VLVLNNTILTRSWQDILKEWWSSTKYDILKFEIRAISQIKANWLPVLGHWFTKEVEKATYVLKLFFINSTVNNFVTYRFCILQMSIYMPIHLKTSIEDCPCSSFSRRLVLKDVGIFTFWYVLICHYTKKKLHGLSPWANYTDRATAACRRSYCQLLKIEGATWSAWRIPRPYSRFSRQEPLLFYQAAPPQLYSRGWVDPVSDPLLFFLVVPGIEPGPPNL
jgi:hypothetical protein